MHGVHGVAGSNPAVPTIKIKDLQPDTVCMNSAVYYRSYNIGAVFLMAYACGRTFRIFDRLTSGSASKSCEHSQD